MTIYTRPGCHLCDDAAAGLRAMQSSYRFELRELDISADDALHRAYFERIPVICLDGEELCEYFLQEDVLRERLESGP